MYMSDSSASLYIQVFMDQLACVCTDKDENKWKGKSKEEG